LENGFGSNESNCLEHPSFLIAMERGNDLWALELLDHQQVQDKNDCDTYLRQAFSKGLHRVAARLIELGAPIDRRDEMGLTVLHVATASGDPDIAKSLLMYG
jgi:ankyrin repeat protein